jgi:triosephosphate isomerase (TIM)
MRKPMMAGNWKMNKTPAEAVSLAEAIRAAVASFTNVACVVCPPALALPGVVTALEGSGVAVGAQNVHWADSGAYTGEISAPMLHGLAQYVIIGHSERRQHFGETNETVNKKLHAVLTHGLTPILCVGETLAQNQGHETAAIVSGQVSAALAELTSEQVADLIIAYEPIWAIGTGLAATSEQAQTICGAVVRHAVSELYGPEVAATCRILYGGSTSEKNIGEIMAQPDIDGALIGGASLKSESYGAMVRITSELYR